MRDATWFSFLFLEKAKKRRELTYCGEEFTIGELERSEMFKVHCKPSSRKWIVSLNVRIRFIFFVKNFFLVLVWLTAFPLPLKFPPILQKALSEPLTLAVSLQRLGIGLLFSSFAFLLLLKSVCWRHTKLWESEIFWTYDRHRSTSIFFYKKLNVSVR